ncbi:MAG TPA: hypothetical protein VM327_05140 [Candidatus Thermoplasmatota archaeon]|nr:hypothetical protein [Candidatus Thermoplasmatota archaeon]
MHKLAALLVAVPLLAGCLSQSADLAKQAGQALSLEGALYDGLEAKIGAPIGEEGNIPGAPDQINLARLATLSGAAGRTPQPTEGYVETAVKGGYAYLCRTGPDQGLVIFDVHDLAHPKQVGYLNLEAGFEADVEVSDDGKWAFWETQRFPTSGETPGTSPNPGSVLMHGISIIDISDKANPRWAGFQPVTPDGPHSITYANITGPDGVHRHILFASAYSYAYVRANVNVPMQQREIIYELDTTTVPGVATLKELYTYTDPNAGQLSPINRDEEFPHDVTVSVHPLTHRTYAYISYWNLGVVILDVTIPSNPVRVGQAIDFGAAPTREIHMARQSEGLIDGKVILVTEPEIGAQPTTGYMSHIDISDPTHPVFLSNWKIPGNATSGGGGRGPHYFDLREGRVAMASYSAGFWVYDIHDHANLLRPRTVAYALVQPGGGAGLPGPLAGLGGGSAFDAWWADRTHVIGSDTGKGLVVFEYLGPAPPVDVPATVA